MKRHHNRGLRKCCDCPRRKWNDCPHSWRVNFKPKGGSAYRIALDRHYATHIRTREDAAIKQAEIIKAIHDGTFRLAGSEPLRLVSELAVLTVDQLLQAYLKKSVAVTRASMLDAETLAVNVITRTPLETVRGEMRPFGAWAVADVTTATIEAFRAARRVKQVIPSDDPATPARRSGGVVAANRNLALLRAAWNWAVLNDYWSRTPFKKHDQRAVALEREFARNRRLEGDEEDRLKRACNPSLWAIVEALLESGCRAGEILSLTWAQVQDGKLYLPGAKTKTRRPRWVPISMRLQAILDMRRTEPDGTPMPAEAHVFGTPIGTRRSGIKQVWRMACQRAGITNLHAHDLRRECASRWLEGGVPLQTVSRWLGHASIAQTSVYLAASLASQETAMKAFDAARIAAERKRKASEQRMQRRATNPGTTGHEGDMTGVNRGDRPQ